MKFFLFGFSAVLFSLINPVVISAQAVLPVPENTIWERPIIVPVAAHIIGVNQSSISLKGIWKINVDPPSKFWENNVLPNSWRDVPVPAQLDMQGVKTEDGKEYAYKKKINIPADYKGQRIFLRFEGVSGTAKAWINGHFLKEHYGGFNVWTCDVTDYVTPGQDAWLTIGITENTVEKTTNGFDRGGIIRDIKLMATAPDYIYRFNVETDFDDAYRNAVMKIWLGISFNKNNDARVQFNLTDSRGKAVYISPVTFLFSKDEPEAIIKIPVNNPVKWDAEHPELYQLRVNILDGNTVTQVIEKQIGFREIKVDGVRMLVNGNEIKLRGAGRFDSDPVYGRYLSDEESLKEVKMLKEANLNFVRPSCYPASEGYLEACDKIGLYVQLENSVTFTRGSQNDTAMTKNYLSMMAEMIEVSRSHPSVIIYELANETHYGINIGKTYQYAKAEDPTRPVIFSWAQSVPADVPWPFDIFSVHYPDWNADLGSPSVAAFNSRKVRPLPTGMPVLLDEFAHGSSYYQPSLARDPGMRNFWGESIKRFWENMFTTTGCLGGAMWAIIDENAAWSWAYEWGAIDLWRRKRPEYWHFKKAYSPVRIDAQKPINYTGANKPIVVPVKNWYDHTNLNELTIHWSVNGQSGKITGPSIKPHNEGLIGIPTRNWKKDDVINLKFYDGYNSLIDEFNLSFSLFHQNIPAPTGTIPVLKEDVDQVMVSGKDFEVSFSKQDGMITSGKYKGKEILKGGPYFHLAGAEISQWKLKKISAQPADKNEVFVTIEGAYDSVDVVFDVSIDGTGLITTQYTLGRFSVKPPMPQKIPWDKQDAGGFEEVGISYLLSDEIDKLSWKRKGLWSVYPDDHIGRNEGTANRDGANNKKQFGKKPEGQWWQDEKDFSVFGQYDIGGRGTNDFRSLKENVYEATASAGSTGTAVKIFADADIAVRLQVQQDKSGWIDNDDSRIIYSGTWKPTIDSANFFKQNEMRSTASGDYAEFNFNGNAIAWISSKQNSYGLADVFVDDTLVAADINFTNRYGFIPQAVVFSKEGLPKGNHTIKIVAKPNQQKSTVIPLDAFAVYDSPLNGDVELIINNLWNHTKMGLGNYMKDPILIGSQYRNKVRFRLTDVQ